MLLLLLYLVKGSCNVMFIDNEMDIFVIALCKLVTTCSCKAIKFRQPKACRSSIKKEWMSFVQTIWWSFTYLLHSEMHDKSTVHWSSAHWSGWIRFTLDISRGHVSCIEVEHTSVQEAQYLSSHKCLRQVPKKPSISHAVPINSGPGRNRLDFTEREGPNFFAGD